MGRLGPLAALPTTVLLLATAGVLHAGPIVAPNLAARAAALAPGAEVAVIVRFAGRPDVAVLPRGRAHAPALVRALRGAAARDQAGALALLRRRGLAGRARVLWIDDALALRVTAGLLDTLGRLPGVASIEADPPVRFTDDVAATGTTTTAWNLAAVGAPALWSAYACDGRGIVIGSMDTGVDTGHVAVGARWRGGPHAWRDFVNGRPAPYDDHGHGTHTIGTMVGGDGPGPLANDVGVAPGACFISAKVLDRDNSFSTASVVMAGAQWMLDPDGDPDTDDFPQVVCNSWYFTDPAYAGFHSTVEAWRAAGIIPVFCIGNDGPGSATTRAPGNYDDVIGVGATDDADAIAWFSSRGPAPAGAPFPADRRKPDLCAPGVGVVSAIPGGGYQAWSGTSMAAPHVAAAIALLLQERPGLDYDEVRDLLLGTAVDRGAAGWDADTGHGRLDAFAAVSAARAAATSGARAAPMAGLRATPNPSAGAVSFEWPTPGSSPPVFEILDLQGRRVWRAATSAGASVLRWDGRDQGGAAVAPGLYFARCTDGRTVRTTRIVRAR